MTTSAVPQPELGDECRWCGDPAQCTIEVESGRKTKTGRTARATARACERCAERLELANPRRASRHEQDPLFDPSVGRDPQPRGAWWHP